MRLARWLITLAGAASALLPVTASAHPYLVSANPPPGRTAPSPPAHVILSFAEALDPYGSGAAIIGGDGRSTPWPSTVSADTLALSPPALPDGAWDVRWTVTGSDGDRQTGDYRFTVAQPAAVVPPGTGAAPPGALERAGRIILLLLGVPLSGLLLLGAILLPLDPRHRQRAGRRLAAIRSGIWSLQLLALCGFTAGLVAAGGTGMLITASSGPPLLVALAVTAALAVAVFDGGALTNGEPASRPTLLLGAGLGLTLLAALVALVEAPAGAGAMLVGSPAVAIVALAVGAAIATAAGGEPLGGRIRRLPEPEPVERPAPPVPALTLSGEPVPHTRPAAAAPPPPPEQAHPLPAGTPVHRRLSGHFVDLERMLETLEWSAFTGYVRVEAEELHGVILLVAGEVTAARMGGAEPVIGDDAVELLADEASQGEAMLDVVGLDTETAWAVVDLLSAPPLFSGLRARMIDLDGVLADLGERHRDGTVVVSAEGDTGVILVRGGRVHGAYTRTLPRLDGDPEVVTALAGDDAAVVEVRVAPRRNAPARPEAAPPLPPRPDPSRDEPFWDQFDEMRQAAARE